MRRDRIIRENSRAQAAEELRIAREGLRIQRRSLHATYIIGLAGLLLAFSQVRHVIVATVTTVASSEKAFFGTPERTQVLALGPAINQPAATSVAGGGSTRGGGGSWSYSGGTGPGGGPPGSGPGGGPPE